MKTLALASATIALAFTASPALAASDGEFYTKDISYSDLNLGTPEGQAKLDQRIESAVRSVCQVDKIRTGTRIRSTQTNACLANARASAKKQVSSIMADMRRGG